MDRVLGTELSSGVHFTLQREWRRETVSRKIVLKL